MWPPAATKRINAWRRLAVKMELKVCEKLLLLLLLLLHLHLLQGHLPPLTTAHPPSPQVHAGRGEVGSERKLQSFSRLPGLCGRLRRRRVTVLVGRAHCWWCHHAQGLRPLTVCLSVFQCNLEKFCWPGRSQSGRSPRGQGQSAWAGQVCLCPRGSRCSHFYIHSLWGQSSSSSTTGPPPPQELHHHRTSSTTGLPPP